jgi:hypothetical protein
MVTVIIAVEAAAQAHLAEAEQVDLGSRRIASV